MGDLLTHPGRSGSHRRRRRERGGAARRETARSAGEGDKRWPAGGVSAWLEKRTTRRDFFFFLDNHNNPVESFPLFARRIIFQPKTEEIMYIV